MQTIAPSVPFPVFKSEGEPGTTKLMPQSVLMRQKTECPLIQTLAPPQQVVYEERLGGATAASEGGMLSTTALKRGLFLHDGEILQDLQSGPLVKILLRLPSPTTTIKVCIKSPCTVV